MDNISLSITEQRILVLLSDLASNKKGEDKQVNVFNNVLKDKFNRSEVHISNSIQNLEKKGFISINGKRGTGRRITVLIPQHHIK